MFGGNFLKLFALWSGLLVSSSLGDDWTEAVVSTEEDIVRHIEPFPDRLAKVVDMCGEPRYRCSNYCGMIAQRKAHYHSRHPGHVRFSCSCDVKCSVYGDCCWDFWQSCPEEGRWSRLNLGLKSRPVCIGSYAFLAHDGSDITLSRSSNSSSSYSSSSIITTTTTTTNTINMDRSRSRKRGENSRNGLNGSTNISRSNDGDESNRNAHSSNSFYKEGGSAKQPSRSKSFEDEDSKSGRSGNGESWGGNRSLNNVVSIRKCTNDEYHRDGVCFNNDGAFVEKVRHMLNREQRPVTDLDTYYQYRSAQDFSLIWPELRALERYRLFPWSPILLASTKLEPDSLEAVLSDGGSLSTLDDPLLAFRFQDHSRMCVSNTVLTCDDLSHVRVKNFTQVCEYFFNPSEGRNRSGVPPLVMKTTPSMYATIAVTGSKATTHYGGLVYGDNIDLIGGTDQPNSTRGKSPYRSMESFPTTSPKTSTSENGIGKCSEYFTYFSKGLKEEDYKYVYNLELDEADGVTVEPDFYWTNWLSGKCRLPRQISDGDLSRSIAYPMCKFTCKHGLIFTRGRCTFPYVMLYHITSVPGVAPIDFYEAVLGIQASAGLLEGRIHGYILSTDPRSCFTDSFESRQNSTLTYYGQFNMLNFRQVHVNHKSIQFTDLLRNVFTARRIANDSQILPIESASIRFLMKGIDEEDDDDDENVREKAEPAQQRTVRYNYMNNSVMVERRVNICKRKPWGFEKKGLFKESDLWELLFERIPHAIAWTSKGSCQDSQTCEVEEVEETRNAVATVYAQFIVLAVFSFVIFVFNG